VSNPDTDALDETGDLNFRAEVRDRKGELVAEQFKRANPGYMPTEANYRAITATLAYNALGPSYQDMDLDQVTALIEGGFWTLENLTACFHVLTRDGLLDVAAGEPRNLSERESLRVARLAQAGRSDEAIGEFLRCSLDGQEPSLEMVSDPRYRNLCNDAVLTVFENAQLDYVATPARQKFLLRYAGSRPLTLALLQRASGVRKTRNATSAASCWASSSGHRKQRRRLSKRLISYQTRPLTICTVAAFATTPIAFGTLLASSPKALDTRGYIVPYEIDARRSCGADRHRHLGVG
jgi:hypothetical protein